MGQLACILRTDKKLRAMLEEAMSLDDSALKTTCASSIKTMVTMPGGQKSKGHYSRGNTGGRLDFLLAVIDAAFHAVRRGLRRSPRFQWPDFITIWKVSAVEAQHAHKPCKMVTCLRAELLEHLFRILAARLQAVHARLFSITVDCRRFDTKRRNSE